MFTPITTILGDDSFIILAGVVVLPIEAIDGVFEPQHQFGVYFNEENT